jgi:hypothetical protein
VLGHADVETTRRYTRSELEDRRAALKALDPLVGDEHDRGALHGDGHGLLWFGQGDDERGQRRERERGGQVAPPRGYRPRS